MSYGEKKQAAERLFAAVAAEAVAETTPRAVTNAVQDFAAELSAEPLERVPVIVDQFGLYGWCSDGVDEKIQHCGGSILFGWTVWEWPLVMLTAEFHAVWVAPEGSLVDITPKPHGETSIIFVPDRNYPPSFNFEQRPINRRLRTYAPRDCSQEAAQQIASMKPAQRDYEARRAAKAGKTLEEWIAGKQPDDALATLIDKFIELCREYEEKMDLSSQVSTGLVVADRELQRCARRRFGLLERVKSELQRHGIMGLA